MKNFFITQDSPENKISFYHLAFFLVLLPFDRFYSQLILVSLILHTLIHINKQRLKRILTWQNLLLSSVILLNIIGMAWSHNKGQAFKDIQRQLAILLFPFILSATGLQLDQYRKKLLMLFGLSCTVAIIYLYADAIRIILYYHFPVQSLFSSFFINHNFSLPIGMHATYLAMYAALSIAIFLHSILQEKKNNLRFRYAIVLMILFSGLLQLASKSVLIATFIFIAFGFPLFMLEGNRKIKFTVVSVVVLLIVLFGVTRIDAFKKRYLAELKDDLVQGSFSKDIPEPRLIRWRYALQLVRQSPVIGHGSGSEKILLSEKYFDNKLYISYLKDLNAHSQYMSLLIKTGGLGLIVFLVTLFAGFAAAWRSRDFIFVSFVILISIVSFSENTLDVNKGIFFYAFFFSFFILSGKPFDKFSRFTKEQPVVPG